MTEKKQVKNEIEVLVFGRDCKVCGMHFVPLNERDRCDICEQIILVSKD